MEKQDQDKSSTEPRKLTKTTVAALPLAVGGSQYTVMDTELRGFGVRVGKGGKTFIAYKRLPHGKPKRVTLGKWGPLTVEQARKLAMDRLSALTQGVDINAERRLADKQKKSEQEAKVQTFGWLLDEYKAEHLVRTKGEKDGTMRSFQDTLNFFCERPLTLLDSDGKGGWKLGREAVLENWLNRPFREITHAEVRARFELLAKSKPLRLKGGVLKPMTRTFQIAFKFAHAAFNFIIPRLAEAGDEEIRNPFDTLKTHRLWTAVGVRSRLIDFKRAEGIGVWLDALFQYRVIAPVPSDFILFSLLQAARGVEVRGLLWEQVDLEDGNVTYDDTKNGGTYCFPLSRCALEILKRRKKENPEQSPWVWAYAKSKTGHIPKDAKHHFHQLEQFGASYVSSHDLRRTWATAALSLGHEKMKIDYLLKHARSGVDQHYFIQYRDELLAILQSVEDAFMKVYNDYKATKVGQKR
jgi:integrase